MSVLNKKENIEALLHFLISLETIDGDRKVLSGETTSFISLPWRLNKTLRIMIGGAKRQLPSWMAIPAATDQASKPKTKEKEDKESDVKELDTKPCGPHKKIQKPENPTHLHENCGEKRKSTMRDENGQSNNQDEDDSDLTNKARKKVLQGDERCELKKCVTSRRGKKQGSDDQGLPPRRKKQKEEVIMDGDDELTVDDLISIAEEYVNAERDRELMKTQDVCYRSETQPLVTSTSETRSEKDLNSCKSGISPTNEESSGTCALTEPSSRSGTILDPGGTVDPIQRMLELFLGPLKTAQSAERKNDDMKS